MVDAKRMMPKPVNVASVPQRSPFRYPGGKTWFVPTFRKWMASLCPRPCVLIEPFAGGGTISLTALFENLVDRVVMAELDEDVAAVWQSIVNGDAKWLADRITNFNLTRETVLEELSKKPTDLKHRAFQTILKNRTYHGGILADGSSMLKYGESGKGIRSRWYPQTLAKRFVNLDCVAERIDFRCQDGLTVLREFASQPDVVYFIDPPYTAGGKKAGKRLYKYCDLDHDALFSLCETLKGDFLITYDSAEEVKGLARRHSFEMRLITMTNTHHAEMKELVIGRDLSWMDDAPLVREQAAKYAAGKAKNTKSPLRPHASRKLPTTPSRIRRR
ncbi:MAG: DNA adenine methylase [Acidobacteria bacterium]|nr:DNA adenine methylase [Acidobacteriota bacterium]